jgi:iron complex outermembrane recepter protein
MVPGLNVNSVNSSQWAVSARGFNQVFSNKLLVLIDGRSIYTPLFAGVYWDSLPTTLEDIDRIEVIRGPGATVWGANAVNGVINIVTRDARDTQGVMLYGGGGNLHPAMSGVRYGDRIGENTYYRVFGGYHSKDDYPLPDGSDAGDAWASQHTGFRMDSFPDPDTQVTWLGDATFSQLDDGESDGRNLSTLGRWTRETGVGRIETQSYYNQTRRSEATRSTNSIDTFDFTLQHDLELGDRNTLTWGLGYRYMMNEIERGPTQDTATAIEVRNDDFDLHLFSGFVQNEFQLVPDRVSVTGGVKLEHNDFTGFEVQPSIRATFKATEQQMFWAAVSRAVRTPSSVEGRNVFVFRAEDNPIPGPGGLTFIPTVTGDADPGAEILHAFELGYRIQPGDTVSVDVAAFYNEYRDLIAFGRVDSVEFGAPGSAFMPMENALSAETYGGEVAVNFFPVTGWRVTASYSLLFADVRGSDDYEIARHSMERSAPRHQVGLRSAHNLTDRASIDAMARYVDTIDSVPSYVTADLRFGYKVTEHLEASIVGQNLLDRQHLQTASEFLATTAEVPRRIYGKMVWRF